MSQNPKSESSSSLIPLVASIGLFLVTTAVSQWARNQRYPGDEGWDIDDDNNGEDDDINKLDRSIWEWYEHRRVQGRLSYENLHHMSQNHMEGTSSSFEHSETTNLPSSDSLNVLPNLPQENSQQHQENIAAAAVAAAVATINNSNNNNTAITAARALPRKSEWDLHIQNTIKQKSSASNTELVRRRSDSIVEVHPNSDYDFHPKNRNWRHFEHFNERDREKYMAKMTESQRNRFETAELEEEESSEDSSCDEAQSISSEGSGSSEEQFVWMKHNHRARDAADDNDETTPWPEFLSRKISSGLTQLFETASDNNSPKQQETQPLHLDASRHSQLSAHSVARSIPVLTSNDSTVRHRNHQPVMSRRTMSSPDLRSPKRNVKRMLSANAEPGHYDDSISEPRTEINNRILRAQYNAHILPEKLVMVRHGQSMGNINEVLYSTTPDNAMPLTDLGWKQAREAGKILKDKILGTGQTVHFIVSPYVRTVETFHGIVSAWCDPKEFDHIKDKEKRIKAWYGRLIEMGLTWNEDSRIREQDFGNYQDPETIKKAKQERHRFGVFYYRFPHGESASDVFDRVSTFLDSLWRSFEMNRSRNYVLVTHGISIRVLLARYFRYTIDQFNMLANPRNCEMVVLGHNDGGKLELEGRCALEMKTNEETGEQEVGGYKFHKRLRILPRSDIRKVRIRISPDEK